MAALPFDEARPALPFHGQAIRRVRHLVRDDHGAVVGAGDRRQRHRESSVIAIRRRLARATHNRECTTRSTTGLMRRSHTRAGGALNVYEPLISISETFVGATHATPGRGPVLLDRPDERDKVFKCTANSREIGQRARRQKIVNERQRGLKAARQRRVVHGADQRVEPDQPVTAPLQSGHLRAQDIGIASVPAVRDEQHHRAARCSTRRAHC